MLLSEPFSLPFPSGARIKPRALRAAGSAGNRFSHRHEPGLVGWQSLTPCAPTSSSPRFSNRRGQACDSLVGPIPPSKSVPTSAIPRAFLWIPGLDIFQHTPFFVPLACAPPVRRVCRRFVRNPFSGPPFPSGGRASMKSPFYVVKHFPVFPPSIGVRPFLGSPPDPRLGRSLLR